MPSRAEEKLYQLLRQTYPGMEIIREYTFSNGLRLDFYIPELNVAWETDGAQHAKFVGHFYATKSQFYIAQNRDEQKDYICEGLGINLVRIPHDYKLTSDSEYLFPARGTGEIQSGYEKYLPKKVETKQRQKAVRKNAYQQYKNSDAYRRKLESAREVRKKMRQKYKESKS